MNEENQNITIFLNTWTTQPGYPVVHIKHVDDKTISLRQERFFFKKYERNSTNTWHIPITWATYNNLKEYFDTVPKFWLTEKETQINSLEFSLFNVQQSGKIKNQIYKNIIKRILILINTVRSAIINVNFFLRLLSREL